MIITRQTKDDYSIQRVQSTKMQGLSPVIGGLARSQKQQRILKCTEEVYMQIAYKANRSDRQREERRNKRK